MESNRRDSVSSKAVTFLFANSLFKMQFDRIDSVTPKTGTFLPTILFSCFKTEYHLSLDNSKMMKITRSKVSILIVQQLDVI